MESGKTLTGSASNSHEYPDQRNRLADGQLSIRAVKSAEPLRELAKHPNEYWGHN